MYSPLFRIVFCAGVFIAASCATYSHIDLDEQRFTSVQVTEDFDDFLSFVNSTHPSLAYSADLEQLDAAAAKIRQTFHDGMTQRDAWAAMALINPFFGDAHVGLLRPVEAIAEYELNGGKLFPAPVVIDEAGVIRVAESVSRGLGVHPGDEIRAINGIQSTDIVAHLSPRMRGESEKLGRLIMERRFAQYFWIAYGGYDKYVARVKSAAGVRTVVLEESSESEQRQISNPFAYKRLTDRVGYLDISTFEKQHFDRFRVFVDTAFAQMTEDGIDMLIIDLRRNGGGARDVSDLLLNYLTDKPYSAISRITARVTEENISRIPGAALGAVVTVPFQQAVTPPERLENRFDGTVYALISPLTYSQAIVFASTLQDYEIATIVGEETEGPANQTGQVQAHRLPNTGLEALSPIYIFTRASGDTSRRGVIPDIEVENDPLDSMFSVDALVEMIDAEQQTN